MRDGGYWESGISGSPGVGPRETVFWESSEDQERRDNIVEVRVDFTDEFINYVKVYEVPKP